MVPAAVVAEVLLTYGITNAVAIAVSTIVVNLVVSAILGKILAPDVPPGTARNDPGTYAVPLLSQPHIHTRPLEGVCHEHTLSAYREKL